MTSSSLTTTALSLEEFRNLLESQSGKRVHVTVKPNNRSTMLSVRWDGRKLNQANVSLHPMFLRAPRNVMDALACYIRGPQTSFAPEIKQFISIQSHHIPPVVPQSKLLLDAQGLHFDLHLLYNEINQTYFEGSLQLGITWFGLHAAKNRSKISLGLFHAPTQVIKIHRILDQATTPRYVMLFIIYHEMLHSVCIPQAAGEGSVRIHHAEFKKRERQFLQFNEATRWIKEERSQFFV